MTPPYFSLWDAFLTGFPLIVTSKDPELPICEEIPHLYRFALATFVDVKAKMGGPGALTHWALLLMEAHFRLPAACMVGLWLSRNLLPGSGVGIGLRLQPECTASLQ